MTTAAIIPVKGRHELLCHTVARLRYKNKVDYVVCVVSNEEDLFFTSLYCDHVIMHPNNPLAMKWNAGFEYAYRHFDPDAYLFVGSSDWLCDDYLDRMLPELDGYDMIGKPDMHLFDVGRYDTRLCYWWGYDGDRQGEPIGIGRLLSKRIVHKMKGRPFMDYLDNALDYNMLQHVLSFGGKVGLIENKEAVTLSLSCYLWPNKHRFDEHWRGQLPSLPMGDGRGWMMRLFPEGLNILP